MFRKRVQNRKKERSVTLGREDPAGEKRDERRYKRLI